MRKLLLFLFLLTLPCFAQEEWRVEVQLVRLTGFQGKLDYLMDQGQWDRQLKSGGEVLESGTMLMPLDREVAMTLGKKVPIVYSDPRAGGVQVQYTDVGFKASVSPTALDDGRVQLLCLLEKRSMADEKLPLPSSDNFSCNAVLLLKPGQVGLASVARGLVSSSYLKGIYPGRNLSEHDTFVWTVSARRM